MTHHLCYLRFLWSIFWIIFASCAYRFDTGEQDKLREGIFLPNFMGQEKSFFLDLVPGHSDYVLSISSLPSPKKEISIDGTEFSWIREELRRSATGQCYIIFNNKTYVQSITPDNFKERVRPGSYQEVYPLIFFNIDLWEKSLMCIYSKTLRKDKEGIWHVTEKETVVSDEILRRR